MNKFIKALSVMLILTSSVYLPNVSAANSTDMLITIAENNPVLIDRLNDIALNDSKLLQQIMTMADSDVAQLERLIDLADYNPTLLAKLVTIKSVGTSKKLTLKEDKNSPYGQMSTFGTINDDGGIIQN